MLSRYIPVLKDLQRYLSGSGDSTLTFTLLVTAFLLVLAAVTLPAPAKGIILGWVIFP